MSSSLLIYFNGEFVIIVFHVFLSDFHSVYSITRILKMRHEDFLFLSDDDNDDYYDKEKDDKDNHKPKNNHNHNNYDDNDNN